VIPLDNKVDILKSESYNVLDDSNISAKPYSSIVEDTCCCGHKRRQHGRKNISCFDFDESCFAENCNCKRYFG